MTNPEETRKVLQAQHRENARKRVADALRAADEAAVAFHMEWAASPQLTAEHLSYAMLHAEVGVLLRGIQRDLELVRDRLK